MSSKKAKLPKVAVLSSARWFPRASRPCPHHFILEFSLWAIFGAIDRAIAVGNTVVWKPSKCLACSSFLANVVRGTLTIKLLKSLRVALKLVKNSSNKNGIRSSSQVD
ncbi:hypothetical protein Pint_35811 [Pistacia integerrima]|uniref:Uncharacterized protein n=1 Tax=Pistacia integerrima TaxID=434235 RepID=A0ACC0Y3A2_9ROSI|nr:hypothetical protein Pint_35811 [Pistacia integerrima]